MASTCPEWLLKLNKLYELGQINTGRFQNCFVKEGSYWSNCGVIRWALIKQRKSLDRLARNVVNVSNGRG